VRASGASRAVALAETFIVEKYHTCDGRMAGWARPVFSN